MKIHRNFPTASRNVGPIKKVELELTKVKEMVRHQGVTDTCSVQQSGRNIKAGPDELIGVCWCGKRPVVIQKSWVREGLTASCGRKKCHA